MLDRYGMNARMIPPKGLRLIDGVPGNCTEAVLFEAASFRDATSRHNCLLMILYRGLPKKMSSSSILAWDPIDLIDYQDVKRSFLRYQPEPQLGTQCHKYIWHVRSRSVGPKRSSGRRPFSLDIDNPV